MRKIIVALAGSLALTGCGEDQRWRYLTQAADVIVYGNPASIAEANGKRSVELRFFDSVMFARGEESEVSRYEVDCEARTMLRTNLAIYKGERLEESRPNPTDRVTTMAPNTLGGTQLEFACGGGRLGEPVGDVLADARQRLAAMGGTR